MALAPIGLPIREGHRNPDPKMVLAEFIAVDEKAMEAIFMCKESSFGLARLPLPHLSTIPNLLVGHLKKGFKIRCSVINEIVQFFTIAHFPLESVGKIIIKKASVLEIDEVSQPTNQ